MSILKLVAPKLTRVFFKFVLTFNLKTCLCAPPLSLKKCDVIYGQPQEGKDVYHDDYVAAARATLEDHLHSSTAA